MPESVEKAATRMAAWFFPTIIALMVILMSCAVVMGIDISDRQAQQREFDRRAQQSQREADRNAAELTEQMKAVKTQAWLLERRLMDREALDILHGVKQPGDDANGATGNLWRMKPKGKHDGRK
jgi:hypothetical protein